MRVKIITFSSYQQLIGYEFSVKFHFRAYALSAVLIKGNGNERQLRKERGMIRDSEQD